MPSWCEYSKRRRQIRDHLARPAKIGLLVLQTFGQRSSLDEGRGDEEVIAVAAGIIDRDDIGMSQLGSRFRLAENSSLVLLGLQSAGVRQLQRNLTLQERIVGVIDGSEPPCPAGHECEIAPTWRAILQPACPKSKASLRPTTLEAECFLAHRESGPTAKIQRTANVRRGVCWRLNRRLVGLLQHERLAAALALCLPSERVFRNLIGGAALRTSNRDLHSIGLTQFAEGIRSITPTAPET